MRKLSLFVVVLSLLAGAGAASASQINVAIVSSLASTAFETDIVSKITANAPFFTITVLNASAATPTLDVLDGYQALMVIGQGAFQDSATLGTNLQQYIDQGMGHGVVITALSNTNAGCGTTSSLQLCGTFQSGDYWALEPGPQASPSQRTLGTVYVSNSPYFANVSGFDGGTASYRIAGTVNGNATRVADWSDNVPFLAVRSFASGATEVGLNFFPVSDTVGTGGWLSSTQGGLILANAFAQAAGYSGTTSDTPEPASYMVVGGGLGLLALLLRRRSGTLQCESAQRTRRR